MLRLTSDLVRIPSIRPTVAHAYDEWVDIEEIIDATKIYALAAMSWCGYSLR